MSMPNVSDDLVWEVVRNYNALMVKRPGKGSLILSRDPLNLTNTHSRKVPLPESRGMTGRREMENVG